MAKRLDPTHPLEVEAYPLIDELMRFGQWTPSRAAAARLAIRNVAATAPAASFEAPDFDLAAVVTAFESAPAAARLSATSRRLLVANFRMLAREYGERRDNPKRWRDRWRRKGEVKAGRKKGEPAAAAARSPEAAASAAHGTWVEYPFPLRDEVLLRLSLPADLSVDEAERLAGFVRSLGRGGR